MVRCSVFSGIFSYKLRYIIDFGLVEMAISTNPKPTIYRNLYENAVPGVHSFLLQQQQQQSVIQVRRDAGEERRGGCWSGGVETGWGHVVRRGCWLWAAIARNARKWGWEWDTGVDGPGQDSKSSRLQMETARATRRHFKIPSVTTRHVNRAAGHREQAMVAPTRTSEQVATRSQQL